MNATAKTVRIRTHVRDAHLENLFTWSPDRTGETPVAMVVCRCGRLFEVPLGLRREGLPAPTRCPRCRPTRREALALGLPL